MRPGIVLGCTLSALLFAAVDARADADAARLHFEAGKKLRDEGDCTRAILEFDKSVAADKSIGGYYNLGFCHEQLSHRQEAYEAYKLARQLASTKKDDRLREISGALASLLETPHVRLVLPQPLPAGIQIRIDGELVPPSFYSAETVVFTTSATTHAVIVTAPGYEERREAIETKQVRPIELRRPIAKPLAPELAPPPKVESRGWTWQHWSGLAVGAVGIGLFTVGSIMFVSYRIDENNLLERYETANTCPKNPGTSICQAQVAESQRVSLRKQYNDNEQSARDRTPLMLGTAIGGALMIGGGLVLYLTAPKAEAPSRTGTRVQILPVVGTMTGAGVTGTF
jgi:tetratricopeptide (TPR) repeat protein